MSMKKLSKCKDKTVQKPESGDLFVVFKIIVKRPGGQQREQ